MKKNEIEIDGTLYVRKETVKGKREDISKHQYVMVRTYSAGVFAGYMKSREGKEIVLNDARRIWYWKGANSLSQLAQEGTISPKECKFPIPVDEVILTEVVEIIAITDKAKKSIEEVPIWERK